MIKNIIAIVKLLIIVILRQVLKLFWIFPLNKNRIVFSSFEGKQYSCNPKYLFQYILEHYGNAYDYVWVLNKKIDFSVPVKIVKHLSFSHIFLLLTSKYVITNFGLIPFLPKRKCQVFMDTWHGSGAYKSQTLEKKFSGAYDIALLNNRDYRAKITSWYVSGCKRFSEVSAESWNADYDKFLPVGTPRNDIFFSKYPNPINEKVFNALNLSSEYSYILYAPTYRGNNFRKHEATDLHLDTTKILAACENKFGKKFMILFREHLGYFGEKQNSENVIDVSDYPDMQELMLVSDILITDYSSSIWDWCFLHKPAFLFTPDIDEYLQTRSFYTPIEDWPFLYARTNEELCSLILSFRDDENEKRIKNHLSLLGSYERGNASEQITKILGL